MDLILNPFARIRELEELLSKKEKELQETLSRYRAMLKEMAEGVIAFSSSGEVELVNDAAAKIFGLTQEEMLGKIPVKVVRYQPLINLVEKVKISGSTESIEFKVISPEERIVVAYASPIKDEAGRLNGVVVVFHDLTEIRKLEKYRSEFVANVSHELKTPLTAIRSCVETLLAGAAKDPKYSVEFLKKIERQSRNLSNLIDDILEISRLETKTELGAFSKIDLKIAGQKAIESIVDRIKQKRINLEEKCEGENFFILGIEDQVIRAILNLLDNAANYTPEGGKIEISYWVSEGEVAVSIKDNGIGISKEHLPRIFERFYRVDKARSRELGGTGLGLAIVKHIMEVHNGRVEVESEVGVGSKFTLVFPRLS